jgi:hypothetical protein
MSSCTCDLIYNYDNVTHHMFMHVEAMCIGRSPLFIINGMQKNTKCNLLKKKKKIIIYLNVNRAPIVHFEDIFYNISKIC